MIKIKKIGLFQILILATLTLNTGCVFNLFDDTITTPIVEQKKVTTIMPTSTVAPTTLRKEPLILECTDDINGVSSCNKGLIPTEELKPKLITQTGGEVHTLRSFQGQKITVIERSNGYIFPEFENKIVILEMFGKNCSHCIKEMPIMNKLRKKYGKNLEIIALQVEGQMSKFQAKALIRRHHIAYPVISGETATNLQFNIQNTYGWTGILPFIMVIKDGVTEFSYRGEVSYREINNDIRSLLK